MKCSKAAGPSGIVAEFLKATGEEGVELTRQLTACFQLRCDHFRLGGELHSEFLNLYKSKGEALDRGNYRGLKLTDQVMKLLERVLDFNIRKMVNISELQFGFVPGRCTTDAIIVLASHLCTRVLHGQ